MPPSDLPRRDVFAGLLALVAAILPARPSLAGERVGVLDCPTRDCGWVYDPAIGDPDHGIPPGVAFEDLPDDWACPNCGRIKDLW